MLLCVRMCPHVLCDVRVYMCLYCVYMCVCMLRVFVLCIGVHMCEVCEHVFWVLCMSVHVCCAWMHTVNIVFLYACVVHMCTLCVCVHGCMCIFPAVLRAAACTAGLGPAHLSCPCKLSLQPRLSEEMPQSRAFRPPQQPGSRH